MGDVQSPSCAGIPLSQHNRMNMSYEDKLSECARLYAKCLENPTEAAEGCIPATFVAPPSRKLKVWASGGAASAAGGIFFVMVRPLLGAASNAATTSLNYVTYSDGLAVVAATNNNSSTLGVDAVPSNSPFNTSSFSGTTLQVRHVATEIQVWNETSPLSRQGSLWGLCEPDHGGLNNVSSGDLAAYESSWSASIGAGDKRYSLKWNGVVDPSELEYTSDLSAGTTVSPNMVICSGPNTTAQSWRFRVTSHYEIIGRAATGKTDNWVDPAGAGIVNNAAASAARAAGRHHSGSSEWLSAFRGHVLGGLRHLAPMARSVALAAAPHLPVAALSYATGNPGPLLASVAGKGALVGQAGKKKKGKAAAIQARR